MVPNLSEESVRLEPFHMTEQPVVVQKISWQDLCPWTLIFKTLPVASSVSVLMFAMLGVVLIPMGWMLSEVLFVHQAQRDNPQLMEYVELNASPYRSVFLASQDEANSIPVMGVNFSGPRLVFDQMVKPFKQVFTGKWGGWGFFYFLFGSAWSLLVWSFVGLAIARICLLKLTRNEQSGIDDAFEFACDNWITTAGALAIPLAAVAVLCIPAGFLGVLMGADFGVVIVGLLWVVVLAIAAVIALLLLGLLFGWPLMISSVAAESQNSFDAMTRSYAYTFQRPIHYLMYMLVAILFGGFCWMIVVSLTNGIIDLAYWSTSWGTNLYGTERIEIIQSSALSSPMITDDETAVVSKTLEAGQSIIGLWNALARTLAAAFMYGMFWCMASAIYLLLRKDVDETETDEIFVSDERRTYDLPPLQSDENGIPQVQELVPVDENTKNDDPNDDPPTSADYDTIVN